MLTATYNTNTTINISSQNVSGPCDLKCSYNFKYNESNLVASNHGVFLSFTYDKGTTSPVVYNTQNYYVSKIILYAPSLHKFDDNLVNAELVIEHSPEIGGDLLYVCIPITSSTNSSDASNMITSVIQNVATNAPGVNETTNLNLSSFNLNNIIPSKPFFSYSGTQGLLGQIIVFGAMNAIPLNSQVLTSLTKIIKPYPITIGGGDVFFNSKGPNTSKNTANGIYISCQPTGSSEEDTEVTTNKNPTNFDLNSMLNDPTTFLIIQIIVACVLFIILFFALNFGYNYFASETSSLNKMQMIPSFGK